MAWHGFSNAVAWLWHGSDVEGHGFGMALMGLGMAFMWLEIIGACCTPPTMVWHASTRPGMVLAWPSISSSCWIGPAKALPCSPLFWHGSGMALTWLAIPCPCLNGPAWAWHGSSKAWHDCGMALPWSGISCPCWEAHCHLPWPPMALPWLWHACGIALAWPILEALLRMEAERGSHMINGTHPYSSEGRGGAEKPLTLLPHRGLVGRTTQGQNEHAVKKGHSFFLKRCWISKEGPGTP